MNYYYGHDRGAKDLFWGLWLVMNFNMGMNLKTTEKKKEKQSNS